MATERDHALIEFLFKGTQSGTVHWEATAVANQFATSFKGKYGVLIDRGFDEREERYWVTLKDDTEARELLRITDDESNLVRSLYHMAQRASLNVDEAIDEILSSGADTKLNDEDIPF